MGWLLGLVVLVLVLLLAWFFLAGDGEAPAAPEVELPEAGAPSVRVPEEVDVNVDVGGEGAGG